MFAGFLTVEGRSNLGLSEYWWIIPLIQLSFYLLLFSLQTLCNLVTFLTCITITSINTFYPNISLWLWLLFLILATTYCGEGQSPDIIRHLQPHFSDLTSPVLIIGLVFVGLFAVLSVLDCFLGETADTSPCFISCWFRTRRLVSDRSQAGSGCKTLLR